MIKHMFYGFVDGGFFPAKLHAEYFAALNIPVERQRYAVNVVGSDDTESFDQEIDSRKNKLLFVGRLIKRKRLDVILEAIAQISDPELRLTIIGDGPERYHLEQLSIQLGINDQVEWLGAKKNNVVREYMRQAIAVLVPSDFEQWGLVVNEAWLSSTLVLGSDQVGALAATTIPQMSWMLLPAADVAAWVKSLKKLLSLSDPERLELVHQTQLIANNYSMSSHIESALALINIAPRPKPLFIFGLLVKLWRGRVRVW